LASKGNKLLSIVKWSKKKIKGKPKKTQSKEEKV